MSLAQYRACYAGRLPIHQAFCSWHTCERPGHCWADGSAMPARFQLVIDCKDPEDNEFDINW